MKTKVFAILCIVGYVMVSPVGAQSTSEVGMDNAFYEALYDYAHDDVDGAFRVMDRALSDNAPTVRWHWHLNLYRRAFRKRTLLSTRPVQCQDAEKWLAGLKSIEKPRDSDLVKLALLGHTRKDVIYDEPALRKLTTDYPQSPWAEWASWMLKAASARLNAQKAMEEAGGIPTRVYPLEYQRNLADLIVDHVAQGRHSSRSIMGEWFCMQLHAAQYCYLDRANVYFDCAKTLTTGKQADAGMKAQFEMINDKFLEMTGQCKDYEEGFVNMLLERGEEDKREWAWRYFQGLRKSGVKLPALIPVERELFFKGK